MSDYTPTTEEVRSKQLLETVERLAYNCECQVGGVDAMSVDTDWLREVAESFAGLVRRLTEVKAQVWEEGITAFDVAITKDVDDPWSQLPDNPYRQGESSGNGASQSPIESDNLLNGEEQ